MNLADLTKQECVIIAEALKTKANRIYSHAHCCATAAGNWNNQEAKRWRDEAHTIEKLAEKFS